MNSRHAPDAKRIVALAAALLTLFALSATGKSAQAALMTGVTNFQPIEAPSSIGNTATKGTFAIGVSGNTVVGGFYSPATVSNGFTSTPTGSTFMPYNVSNSSTTVVSGISGGETVGSYTDGTGTHGFLNNGSTVTSLNFPGLPSPYTVATGVDGSQIVGYINTATGVEGFYYDGTNWTPITVPGAQTTVAYGINGSTIVGYYLGTDNHLHAFSTPVPSSGAQLPASAGASAITPTITTLDYPGSTVSTAAYGIFGNDIVGDYQDSMGVYHGFLFNGSNWTSIDVPNVLVSGSPDPVAATKIYGISGNTIVGEYLDANGVNHGFSAQVPEPSTAILLALGAALVAMARRSRRAR
jgi:hypothetical protein